jgi:hypothetical protein
VIELTTFPGEVEAGNEATGPESHRAAPTPSRFPEVWLRRRLDAAAVAITVAAFGFRIYVASRDYLNADEALHYLITNQRTLWLAYKMSLTNAHPPLFYMILYFWRFLGHSELMLRFPSVFAGTAFCWVLYKWVGTLFGRTAALSALILAAFSPTLISLSAQVRAYALMLLCVAGALYFLERALEDQSAPKMAYFSGALYLAILSHYSAAFFTLALGLYVLARIVVSRPPWKIVATWMGGQAIALAIYVFLYVTHVSKIKPSEMELWASPHEDAFFRWGHGSLFVFTLRKTVAIFRFLFLGDYLHVGLLVVFGAAVVLLLANMSFSRIESTSSWPKGLLLLLPFAAVWAASLTGIYPYSGSRHSAFLAPFAIAGVSFLLAKMSERKLWPAIVLAGLIAAAGQASGVRFEPYFSDNDLAKSQMASATQYMRQFIPQSDTILVDNQSEILLRYYLCDSTDPYPHDPLAREFIPFPCHGYSAISAGEGVWKYTPENFASRFERAAAEFRFRPGDTVWVYQSGWGANLDTELSWYVMKYRCLVSKNFGATITVIPFVVGTDLSPALPAGSPHLSKLHRCVDDPLPYANGAVKRQ